MAAAAVDTRDARTPLRVAGVASVAVRGLVTVPRTASVLGTSAYAAWLLVDDSVVVVSTRDATRLPNGIEIGAESSHGLLANIDHGAEVAVRMGRIRFENLEVDIVRWWDPRPAMPTINSDHVRRAVRGLPATVPAVTNSAVSDALATWSPAALVATTKTIMGKGSGLTPEGDDYLAGVLAAVRIFGESLSHARAIAMLDCSMRPIARLADTRTTTFSAALLCHAMRGQVAGPAGHFMRAIAGRGDVAKSHATLARVGHSSGPALAAGVVCGANAIAKDNPSNERTHT